MNMNVQGSVADEVNRRLAAATRDLEDKYASGDRSGVSLDEGGPTGSAYKEQYMKEQQVLRSKNQFSESNMSSSSSLNVDEDDEDRELRDIRARRLNQLRQQEREKVENLGKGHGQYREVAQDEFLSEVTNSKYVICHFYHKDFSRCAIMDHHLAKVAQNHIESKFIKINAEKAPFFIEKLRIKTIPTVVCFIDGVATDKILGFEGLADDLAEGKEDEWPTIKLTMLLVQKGMLNKKNVVDEEEIKVLQEKKLEEMRRNLMSTAILDDDEDLFD